MNRIRFN